ncbi:MAG: hypothetical protein OK455_06835, partial [Thaumarchaeota archaeon]|nr:hypothetical protein [Nitrososphaerota archaeon]
MLVVFTSLVAMPVMAQQDVPVPGAEPIWATLNASGTGNYPGGDELFTVFVINSAPTLTETETVQNMTLTAPFGHNFGIGLPSTISPGQSLLSTIHLQIPTNFTQKSFTANLVVHATLNNGTTNQGVTLTGTANVNIFALS